MSSRASRGAKALVVLLCVSLAGPALADGATTPEVVNLRSATLIPVDSPPVVVEGGVWMSDRVAIQVAEQLPGTTTGATSGAAQVDTQPQPSWVLPTAVALGLGLISGYIWGALASQK